MSCVSLLWTTTLQNSIWIGSHFLRVPEFDYVQSMCQSSYYNINEQREHYSDCVGAHLTLCKRELKSFTKTELLRAQNASIMNSEARESMNNATEYIKILLRQAMNSIKLYTDSLRHRGAIQEREHLLDGRKGKDKAPIERLLQLALYPTEPVTVFRFHIKRPRESPRRTRCGCRQVQSELLV